MSTSRLIHEVPEFPFSPGLRRRHTGTEFLIMIYVLTRFPEGVLNFKGDQGDLKKNWKSSSSTITIIKNLNRDS